MFPRLRSPVRPLSSWQARSERCLRSGRSGRSGRGRAVAEEDVDAVDDEENEDATALSLPSSLLSSKPALLSADLHELNALTAARCRQTNMADATLSCNWRRWNISAMFGWEADGAEEAAEGCDDDEEDTGAADSPPSLLSGSQHRTSLRMP